MAGAVQSVLLEQLYTPAELAAKLGVSIRTLDDWRLNGKGPRALKVSYRTVKYAAEDVEMWLQSLRKEQGIYGRIEGPQRASTRRPVALPVQFPGSGVQRADRFGRRRLKSERG